MNNMEWLLCESSFGGECKMALYDRLSRKPNRQWNSFSEFDAWLMSEHDVDRKEYGRMTKTKAQLRAEAVERLKNNVGARFKPDAAIIAIVGGRVGQADWSLECDKLIDLLADDCDTECYSCAKLAELMAENSQLRVANDDLRAELRAKLVAENNRLREQVGGCDSYVHSEPEKYNALPENADFAERRQEPCTSRDNDDGFVDLDTCTHGTRTFDTEQDSRERLEADVYGYFIAEFPGCEPNEMLDLVCGWLNRQVTITERRVAYSMAWLPKQLAEQGSMLLEKQLTIDALQANVDGLQSKLEDLEDANAVLVEERDDLKDENAKLSGDGLIHRVHIDMLRNNVDHHRRVEAQMRALLDGCSVVDSEGNVVS